MPLLPEDEGIDAAPFSRGAISPVGNNVVPVAPISSFPSIFWERRCSQSCFQTGFKCFLGTTSFPNWIRTFCLLFLLAVSILIFPCAGHASEYADRNDIITCFQSAAEDYQIPMALLLAIKVQETGTNMDPNIVNHNSNGTVDIGLMQINSSWLKTLKHYGITEKDLFDPCINIYVGTWILTNEIAIHGMYKGVGRYHSPTPWRRNRYADRVLRRAVTFAEYLDKVGLDGE